MVKKITYKDSIIAIIIRSQYQNDGIKFFTPHHFSQQLGYMNRPKGYMIEPHIHQVVERTVTLTQEVLYIKSGKVKIQLYNNDHVFLEEQILYPGDIILLATGGHALEMLEDTEMVEIKQGPYAGDDDKVGFTPLTANTVTSVV